MRLAELILYIAKKCEKDPTCGVTKINKILFLSDFSHYAFHGKPITEAKYIHRDRGPAPYEFLPAIDLLRATNRASIEQSSYFDYIQKRIVPYDSPKEIMFSKSELALVDHIIEYFKKWNANKLSEWTHTLNPWLLTESDEEIPYCSVFTMHNMSVPITGLRWANNELNRLREV